MRNLLIALPLLLAAAQVSRAACGDTTFILSASYNPTVLNNHIASCDDSTMVLKLKAASGVDTVRLQDTLKVRSRPSGTVTRLVGEGAGGGYLVLTEGDLAKPTLVHVFSPDRAILSGFSFVRRALNSDRNTVEIRAKGSIVTDCHFFMLDNASENTTGALLSVAADSSLVERSLFRSPLNGKGRSIALAGGTSGSPGIAATRNEYRSNIFHSTGIYLLNGNFRIYANTFTGSRDPQHPIVVGGNMADPANNLNIEHNLFATKTEEVSPILYPGSITSVKGVVKNAWSRSRPNQNFMVNGVGGKVSGTDTAGANNNVVLPRGFSRYGASAGEFKEYPIVQMRTDSNLAGNPAGWRIPRVYSNNVSSWTNIPDIASSLIGAKLYFPNFQPFIAGRSWAVEGQHIKVGALVDLDSRFPVTPLDSGSLANSSLRIIRYSGDSTRMKVTNIDYNRDYYKAQFNPSALYFFFSNSVATLASNDTAALKTAVGADNWVRRNFTGFADSLLTVPKGVRTGNSIYVKLLHFNADGQAPVLSNGVIATVQGIPRFPANDLSDPALTSGTDTAAGIFNLTVTKKGSEDIDSIRVNVVVPGGSVVRSQSKAAPNQNQQVTFNFLLARGQYAFHAVPVAKVGTAFQAGPQTADTRFYNSQQSRSDSVFVAFKAGCSGGSGDRDDPYCRLDSALQAVRSGGGTIILRNAVPNTPFPPFESDTIAGPDSTPVVITVPVSGGQFDAAHRVVFRGTADKEALLVTRKNVTLRGIVFEMPAAAAGVPALAVKAGGAVVDGCLFRPVSDAAAAPGPAVHMEPGNTQSLRFVNNVVWGYAQGLRIQSASEAIRILHNTLIDEPQINSTPTVGLVGIGATLAPVVANNWFSGIDTPYVGFAGKGAVLDHNAYALAAGNPLQGLQETGTIDSVDRLGQLDLTQNDFTVQLADAVDRNMECDALEACNGLYAGSSSNAHGPAIATDFTGKPRSGKPDIGAVDAKADPTTVRGVLGMDVRTIPAGLGGHEKLAIRVTPKTHDPQDVDSVYVWWSEGANASFDGNKPFRKFSRASLESGAIADTITGLKSLTTYHVYAALGKVVGGERKLGYGYTHSAMTDFKRDTSDCRFTPASLVCPAAGGVFSVPDGDAKDDFFTKVSFAQHDSGTVKVPQVVYPGTAIQRGRVRVFPSFPLITLSVESAALKSKGSKQSWKAEVTIKANPIELLAGQDLYILRDSASAPLYVPTWSIRPEGTGAVLTIEGHQAGTFTYAFASQVASTEAAAIVPTEADDPPVFNFSDSSVNSVPYKFRGTGFATGNPLVVVTPIPSAGLFNSDYQTVVGGKHKNSSLILSSGFEDLDDSLRNDRLYRYFQQAVAADAKSPAPAGRVKPFLLREISLKDFEEKVILSTPSLAVSGSGEAREVDLELPIDREYRYPDAYSPVQGHGSNSIEVLFTVFDGSTVTRSSGYIRTRFTDADLTSPEKSQRSPGTWHLFSFPWDEAESDNLNHLMMVEPDVNWDPAKRRIMRYKGTGSGEGAFEIYNGSNAGDFEYDEGRAIWSASSDFYTPRPIAATSLDYKPYTLRFSAGQWNDFGLPFNFPIKWTDILDANPTWPGEVKVWRYLPEERTWEPLTAVPANTQDVVHPWDGLAVFPAAGQFPGGTAPSLTIPVLDSARSAAPMVPAAKSAAGQAFWTAKVTAYNATASMGLWIGVQDREDAFGKAPEVPGQDFRIHLKEQGPQGERLLSGLHRASSAGDWRGHWAIQGSAAGEGIRLRAGENPRGIPLHLVETLSRKVTTLAPGAEAGLSPEDLRTGDYHLVAGDSHYLQGFLDGLVPLHTLELSNYPNPFNGATLIRYALPDSYGQAEFRLKVRDSRGRLVWERAFRGSNTLRYLWDGRDRGGRSLGAGFYTLSLEAVAPGKAPRKAVRRLLKM